MNDHIVGICRFSFLGRGDWGAYIGTARGSEAEAEALRQSALQLYAEDRLRFRFRAFEALTLASMRAQAHEDFTLIVLSSTAMPAAWQARLGALCLTLPQARLVLSDETDVAAALAPHLRELSAGGRRLVQFRLDDDDCVPADFTARLARAGEVMRDYDAFAFSLPRTLLATRYGDAAPARYEQIQPFHAAGAAVALPVRRTASRVARSIFAFGHFALMRRFPALTDPGPYGALQLKVEGHDSRTIRPNEPGLTALDEAQFAQALATGFPFLDQRALADLLAVPAAPA
ncbi:glycosyltransferase [Paracoccus lutimaris]|uniref:Putative rhamnosyltransferase n=1 Tax=Paracoccus lutimaris TaxID=1490030 RepID=A0A368YQ37_9RHOB|nr:glycosyltransferase [Paracoccus lutimaris]RCW81386.1 putative rhamnosyltransferase [Paracoccus lutimaris]